MIEPSESARRIASTLRRLGVTLEGPSGAPDALVVKRGFGMMLGPFVERLNAELDEAPDLADNTVRMLKLRLKQLEEVGTELGKATAGDRFEAPEIAVLASLIDVTVLMLGVALGKEFRADSP